MTKGLVHSNIQRSIQGILGAGIWEASVVKVVMDILATTASTRASECTVMGYASGAAIADGQTLLTVPPLYPAFEGARQLADGSWSSVDTNGVPLTTELQNADSGTNLLWDSSVPATQTTSVTAGVHTLQVIGTGSAIISSGFAQLTDEAFTSASDVAVALAFDTIVAASTNVTTVDGLTTYTEGTDYTIDVALGTITVLSTGTMLDLTGYLIDYQTNHNYTGEVTATDGAPNTFTVTTDGTVTITPTAPLDYFQLETGGSASPIIITPVGATASRAADNNTIPTPSIITPERGAIEIVCTPKESGAVKTILASGVDGTNSLYVAVTSTSVYLGYVVDGIDYGFGDAYIATVGTEFTVRISWSIVNGLTISAAATPDINTAVTHLKTLTLPAQFTTIFSIGNKFGVSVFPGNFPNNGITFWKSLEDAQQRGGW